MKTKKFYLVFVLVFIFIIFLFIFILNKAFALQIKRVNYSASNNNDRWIEIFNDGEDILDFTSSTYKIIDSEDDTNHSITTLLGDKSFLKNSTAYISPSTNIPTGGEKVFRSAYKLDKTNGFVIVKNTGANICFNYGNGVCSTTPNPPIIDNPTSTTSTSTTQEIKTVYVYIPMNNQMKYGDIQVHLPSERIVSALADVDYTVKVTDSQNKIISDLDFNWSFGDGGEKNGKNVSYHYTYPGEYTLLATADGFTSGGQARMNVKVVRPDISISKVGIEGKENFIEIKNNTEYDLFLSNFFLKIDGAFYRLPKNLLIAKNKSLNLSGEALGFKLPASEVSLLYPNKEILVSYKEELNLEKENINNTNNLNVDKAKVLDSSKIQDNDFITQNIPSVKKLTKGFVKTFKADMNKENIILNDNFDLKDIKDKSVNKELILKRLVFAESKYISKSKENLSKNNLENKINIEIDKKDIQNKKNDSVDIGIIKWIKNLLY